jgi:mRNA interferase MazF
MRRGEVRLVRAQSPSAGAGEPAAWPGVIVSNDGANAAAEKLGYGMVTVVPLIGAILANYPFQVPLPAGSGGLNDNATARADEVRSVPIESIGARLGRLAWVQLAAVDQALRVHLHL